MPLHDYTFIALCPQKEKGPPESRVIICQYITTKATGTMPVLGVGFVVDEVSFRQGNFSKVRRSYLARNDQISAL
jgi:hypothetical protein